MRIRNDFFESGTSVITSRVRVRFVWIRSDFTDPVPLELRKSRHGLKFGKKLILPLSGKEILILNIIAISIFFPLKLCDPGSDPNIIPDADPNGSRSGTLLKREIHAVLSIRILFRQLICRA
jgi:hypothetical protein